MIILLQVWQLNFVSIDLFWQVLQSSFITDCDRLLLQSASGITKCDRLILQSTSGITKCERLY